MKILHASSEFYPLIKTGGLADVLGALPFAQSALGHEVRVVLPYYHDVRQKLPFTAEVARRDTFAGYVVIRYAEYQGIGLYLIDAPHLYDRKGNPYHNEHYQDYADNVYRFGLLGWAAAAIATGIDPLWGKADILHAHDWQAGLAPLYLTAWGRRDVKSVFTIHNLAYQGCFYPHHVRDLWLPDWCYQTEGAELYGQFSFLKAGLFYSDHSTTVSPTYAQEIQTPEQGYGLDGLLRHLSYQGRLHGILNGVDETIWNPKTDTLIVSPYDAKTLKAKAQNKAELQKRFALKENPKALLLTMVSRLTEQKGADLLYYALQHQLKAQPSLQFILLGSGDKGLQSAFEKLAHEYPEQVACYIGYHEALSHQLIAGADAIVVPSRFEPCGLTQLYGLKYGTLPLVRKTGGLADTVMHDQTGVVFEHADVHELSEALYHLLQIKQNPETWQAMMLQAMKQDFGWEKSAKTYQELYQGA
ncbi:MAG: glycogen synthase GlgA [Cardiobacteriaceae bacterium]|nr:glycogen synthase GlgA [Cardiobacteriaceae bacterium]